MERYKTYKYTRWKRGDLLDVKTGGTYNNHSVLKMLNVILSSI
jgi:hypothetical protein